MEDILGLLFLIVGWIVGSLTVFFVFRNRPNTDTVPSNNDMDSQIAALNEHIRLKDQMLFENKSMLNDLEIKKNSEIDSLRSKNVALSQESSRFLEQVQSERRSSEEKMVLLNEAQNKLSDAFKALSSEALNTNNKMFLDLAKENLEKYQEKARLEFEERQKNIDLIVKPLKESLEKVDVKISEMEKVRIDSYATLTEQVRSMATTQVKLQSETGNLVKALRAPTVRGRWGEIQLRRVVELAGMIEYCDFDQQHTVQTEDGKLRPDMVVKLPNHKTIVVDSKAPLSAYLESLEAETDESRSERLEHHASQIRKHVDGLSSKAYWSQIDCTPELVVMFIPGEVFFSAALEKDPELIEYGVNNKVIIATPTSLIAVLKSVAYGWSQEHIAEHAQEVKELGIELYDRTLLFADNFVKCGKDLSRTVESYNKAVGSLESRLLVTTRRFKELEITDGKEIESPDRISKMVRDIQVKELKKEDG